MSKVLNLAPLFFICFFYLSCQTQTVLVSDRHRESYSIIKEACNSKDIHSLVLFDYHNDVNADEDSVSSYNWVGKLIEEDSLSRVYWISGNVLSKMNRNARNRWLERNLVHKYPDSAEKIRNAIVLLDFDDLKKTELKEPFLITLDFDVLTKDPGKDADEFVIDMAHWIQKQKSPVLTLSLSSVYQPNPQNAWKWFELFLKNYSKKANWFINTDHYEVKAECPEEAAAWNVWRDTPEVFQQYDCGFYTGAYNWINAPSSIQKLLLEKKIKPYGPEESLQVINSWKLNGKKTENGLLVEDVFNGIYADCLFVLDGGNVKTVPELKGSFTSNENLGIAVRFRNAWKDRGCLSLYYGVDKSNLSSAAQFCAKEALNDPRYGSVRSDEENDLLVNISLFGTWKEMESPLDFIPGSDAIIVVNEASFTSEKRETLLQPAIAFERGYSKESFLECLCNKAGLETTAYKNPTNLRFYKSKTFSFTKKMR